MSKQNHPLVSVIIPVYNVEKYLNECLDSVVNQTYKNLEIILVNDGSTDRSGNICDEYASGDTRIKVIHKKNSGVSAARNVGIEHSNGEYITFVDSDDFIDTKAIEHLVENAKKYNSDITIGDHIVYHSNGYQVCHSAEDIMVNSSFDVKTVSADTIYKLLTQLSSACTKLYKKSLITKNHIIFPVNIKIGEDFEFLAKALINAKGIVYIDKSVYFYRSDYTNNHSATGTVDVNKAMDFGKALKNVSRYLDKKRSNEKIKGALRRAVIPHSLYALSITETDTEVHKKVFDYLRKDLFPYFNISKDTVKNEPQKSKVISILDDHYTALLACELLDKTQTVHYLEYQLYSVKKDRDLIYKDKEGIQRELLQLKRRYRYPQAIELRARTSLGRVRRKLKDIFTS